MERDFRHKVEHVGDAFADQVETFFDWLKASTRGISLTYNIHCLERGQNKAYARIGKRTVALKPRFPHSEIFSDDDMVDLFREFDRVDEDLARARKEREERLYPGLRTTEQEA
uniref:Magnetosome protein Mad10 n=1 Tax=delta proteobacterium ML-1 TaxID=947513 RepID=U5IHW3_9DELT|nr:magnetosome protein Mad10 [delta proteobacterium ML-1]